LSDESYLKDIYCLESDGFIPIYGKGLLAGTREKPETRIFLVANITIVKSVENPMNDSHIYI
jgi:hypothetical protein